MFANLSFAEGPEFVSTPLLIFGLSVGCVIKSYNVSVELSQKVSLVHIHVNYFMYLPSIVLLSCNIKT